MLRGPAAALLAALWGGWAAPALAQEGNARAEAIAKTSPSARASLAFIESQARQIKDPPLRAAVRALLSAAGFIDPAKVAPDALFPPLPPLSFLAAPGGGTGGHHSYPGGLAEHTAFNLQTALDLEANYRTRYGLKDLDHDLVVAAPILHDLMKPWCLQWRADGTELDQPTIAGTASHHIFILAELIHRGLSPELISAVAAAHEPAHLGEEKVAGFLRAAALLAGADPVQRGLVAAGGKTLARPPSIEGAIDHLSDHDYIVTEPIEQAVLAALETPDRWQALEIQARIPAMKIYAALRARGVPGVRQLVRGAAPRPQ